MASGNSGPTNGQGTNLVENLRDQFLQCKICLDGLKEPKTLPCLHTFCADCLHYHIGHRSVDHRKFPCPICRRHIYTPSNGVDGFPDSFFLQTLNDLIDNKSPDSTSTTTQERNPKCRICRHKNSEVAATFRCLECQIDICDDCKQSHTTTKVTEGHTVTPISPPEGIGLTSHHTDCRIHKGEPVKFYCENCSMPVCLPCTFLDHKDHEVVEIRTVREAVTQNMEQVLVRSSDNLLQLTAFREDLNDLENELFIRKELIKSEIRREVQGMMHEIALQERALLNKVDAFYDTISVVQDRQKLERTVSKLQRSHDFVKQLLEPDTSPIQQLSCKRDAIESLEAAQKYELPDMTIHASKLDCYMHFLPEGNDSFCIGKLLTCTQPGKPHHLTEVCSVLPSKQALFLNRLVEPVNAVGDISRIGEVLSLSFLPSGSLVVLSTNTQTKLKIYNARGHLRFEFGGEEELQHPTDMVVTSQGEIAVTDSGLRRVVTFDQFGTQRACFGDTDLFGLPISLTIDSIGRLLVCDQVKQRITVHRGVGGSGLVFGELIHILNLSIVVTPQIIRYNSGKLYACDTSNDTVHIFSYKHQHSFSSTMSEPLSEDDLDEDEDEVLKFVAKLESADRITDSGSLSFLSCSGIAIGSCGELYISDITSNQVHVFNSSSEISHIKPRGHRILKPTALAVAPNGVLAVCQQGLLGSRTYCDEQNLEENEVQTQEVEDASEVCLYRLVPCDL